MATEGMPEPIVTQRGPRGGDRSPGVQILTHPKTHEVLGILGIAVALFLLASLLSYDSLDPRSLTPEAAPDIRYTTMGGDGERNLPVIFWSCWVSARWPYHSSWSC